MQKKVPQLMKKMIKKNNGTFKKCFAQRLRELRKENGITQATCGENECFKNVYRELGKRQAYPRSGGDNVSCQAF